MLSDGKNPNGAVYGSIAADEAPVVLLGADGVGCERARRDTTRCLIDCLVTEVMRADDPGAAAEAAIGKLRNAVAYRLDLLYGRKRMPAVVESPDAEHQTALDSLWHGADPA